MPPLLPLTAALAAPTDPMPRRPLRPTWRARLVLALALTTTASAALAQGPSEYTPSQERVDLFDRRQTDLDGNVLRTTIFNIGQAGRTGANGTDEVPFEWPKNTRRFYIFLTGLFAGAEVQGENGETTYITDVPTYRDNPNNPLKSWNWAPIAGYVNPASEDLGIARSDRPSTWPPLWPDKRDDASDPGWAGSWSGLFGKNVFNADVEVFYKMGDDQYDRNRVNASQPDYYPDATDRSRAGLGLVVDTRVLAWSQVLIDDAAFILHKVTNDGTKDLTSVGVTLWLADFVGGEGDAGDDQPFFDLLLDTAFLVDSDGRSSNPAFSGVEVGGAVAFFLESPGNATDRIDNDGDGSTAPEARELTSYGTTKGEPGGPVITLALLAGEGDQTGPDGERLRYDGIDNNRNGLVDEDSSRAAFGNQVGVGFADYVDNDGDGEAGSPIVTQSMIDAAASDPYGRWPVNPGPGEPVWLIGIGQAYGTGDSPDLGRGFRDNIDNDGDALGGRPADLLWEPGSPVVTQAMVDAAASDAPYYRYPVPGTGIVLYDVKAEDVGSPYADGVDNDGDGAVDEGIDEGIDEMIDERRGDGIDNDGDWRAGIDDVGLDGALGTGDRGEGDGLPTPGADGLPGEPNVDVTDVSESDQIGITNVKRRAAGGIDFTSASDEFFFRQFLVPGQFSVLQPGAPTSNRDTDLFVSSGLFPLRAGQTESVSFAVILGDVDYSRASTDIEGRYRDLLTKRQDALEAYEADYRFAQAPFCPQVRSVPGDGAVTLYWDDRAEDSFDTFIADLAQPGLDPRDFEGYRVYRSTDPGFLDSRQITDGFGNLSFLRPIAQFDKIDSYEGFHPVAVNGTQFYLGNNTRDPGEAASGLANTFTDSTAVNGVRYYYAVTSYDFGAASIDISPSECPISITIGPDGEVTRLGPNVAQVTPSQAAAGYTQDAVELEQTTGTGSGVITYSILDPTALQDGHRYRVTFRDTLSLGALNSQGTRQILPDTIRTRDVTLVDLTDGQTLFENSKAWRDDVLSPITEGFRLAFNPVPFTSIIESQTAWESSDVRRLAAARFNITNNRPGTAFPADYRIEIGAPGSGQSTAFDIRDGIVRTIPAKPSNVRIFRQTTEDDGQPSEVEVAYVFLDRAGPGGLYVVGTAETNLFDVNPGAPGGGLSDLLLILEDIPGDRDTGLTPTWTLSIAAGPDAPGRVPQAGDVGRLVTRKPFTSADTYEFTVRGPTFDAEAARATLDRVGVVPNPYRGSSRFEVANPFPTGRGERRVRFVNLPPRATIRIFTPSGRLVRTLEMDQGTNDLVTPQMLLNGSLDWNLLNEDQLEVSYGIYLYHVEAPGVGETTGTLALIK